jgi:hypothetical protein
VIKVEDDHVSPTIQSSGETGIAIKYFHFHNSAGDVAAAVYLIADCNFERYSKFKFQKILNRCLDITVSTPTKFCHPLDPFIQVTQIPT